MNINNFIKENNLNKFTFMYYYSRCRSITILQIEKFLKADNEKEINFTNRISNDIKKLINSEPKVLITDNLLKRYKYSEAEIDLFFKNLNKLKELKDDMQDDYVSQIDFKYISYLTKRSNTTQAFQREYFSYIIKNYYPKIYKSKKIQIQIFKLKKIIQELNIFSLIPNELKEELEDNKYNNLNYFINSNSGKMTNKIKIVNEYLEIETEVNIFINQYEVNQKEFELNYKIEKDKKLTLQDLLKGGI